jgi:hypothetical protein
MQLGSNYLNQITGKADHTMWRTAAATAHI